jgi:hypothetical protein
MIVLRIRGYWAVLVNVGINDELKVNCSNFSQRIIRIYIGNSNKAFVAQRRILIWSNVETTYYSSFLDNEHDWVNGRKRNLHNS